jgi:hypothetical protein
MIEIYMIGFSKYRFNLWNKKNFSLAQRSTTYISRFYRTCEKVSLIVVVGDSAGVQGIECDIRVTLNGNTPIWISRYFLAKSYRWSVVIPTIALSAINFNSYAECYV